MFGDVDRLDVFGSRRSSRRQSLINIDETADGQTRYRLDETIRHYALDRLAEAGGDRVRTRRHAEHWARWAVSHNVYYDNSQHAGRPAEQLRQPVGGRSAGRVPGRPDLVPAHPVDRHLIRLDDAASGGHDLFEAALAALDGLDDVAWAHVAMAASVANRFTWL